MTCNEACKILGLPCAASLDEIKKAYRKKAKAYHPDMHEANDFEYYNRKMMDINAAYELLLEHARWEQEQQEQERKTEPKQPTQQARETTTRQERAAAEQEDAARKAWEKARDEAAARHATPEQTDRSTWKTNCLAAITASIPMYVLALVGLRGLKATTLLLVLIALWFFVIPCRRFTRYVERKKGKDIENWIPLISFLFSFLVYTSLFLLKWIEKEI